MIEHAIYQLQLPDGLVEAYQLIRRKTGPLIATEIAEGLRQIAIQRNTTVGALQRGLLEYGLVLSIDDHERTVLYQAATETAKLREAGRAVRADTPAVAPLTAADLWRLHDAQWGGLDELAEMMETTVRVVRKEVEAHGGTPRSPKEGRRLKGMVNKVVKRTTQKASRAEAIAELLDLDVGTVSMIVRARTVPAELIADAAEAWRLHHDQWFSLREVAGIMGLDLPTAWKYVKSNGTPRNWKDAENVRAIVRAVINLTVDDGLTPDLIVVGLNPELPEYLRLDTDQVTLILETRLSRQRPAATDGDGADIVRMSFTRKSKSLTRSGVGHLSIVVADPPRRVRPSRGATVHRGLLGLRTHRPDSTRTRGPPNKLADHPGARRHNGPVASP
ncbi:MAG: hypothetical protein JO287_21495, partial [Pseudonocardiales bacterium]|nr:hypothetical protein [Pseudonocardiales bacterium]